MGAGKSTVGLAVAHALSLPLIDLDALIVEVAGKSIKSIFYDDGESTFRDYESSCLGRLSSRPPSVIATGGGIIGRNENRTFMRDNGTTVYLAAEWATLQQRLEGTTDRPLAGLCADMAKTRELFLDRCPLYEQADLVIQTDQKTVQEIVDDIRNYMQL